MSKLDARRIILSRFAMDLHMILESKSWMFNFFEFFKCIMHAPRQAITGNEQPLIRLLSSERAAFSNCAISAPKATDNFSGCSQNFNSHREHFTIPDLSINLTSSSVRPAPVEYRRSDSWKTHSFCDSTRYCLLIPLRYSGRFWKIFSEDSSVKMASDSKIIQWRLASLLICSIIRPLPSEPATRLSCLHTRHSAHLISYHTFEYFKIRDRIALIRFITPW